MGSVGWRRANATNCHLDAPPTFPENPRKVFQNCREISVEKHGAEASLDIWSPFCIPTLHCRGLTRETNESGSVTLSVVTL